MRKLTSLVTLYVLLVYLMLPSVVLANPVDGALLYRVLSDEGKAGATDGNMGTYENQFYGSGAFLTFTLKTPVTIDAFYQQNGGNGGTIALYNSKGVLVYQTGVSDNSVTDKWTVIPPVTDVTTVKAIASYGTGTRMHEMDIRTYMPSLSLLNGYNSVGSKLTVMNYDQAKKVQQNLLLPYGYDKVK